MKKWRLLSGIIALTSFIGGCSCSKVDDSTYISAVETYKNTDAIGFTRVEIIKVEGQTTYVRKKVEANYIFDSNKDVERMSYSLLVTENNSGGGSDVSLSSTYHYSKDSETLYNHYKIGKSQEERYKYTNTTYSDNFNANKCNDSNCNLMILTNLAPIYSFDEISEFRIEEKDGGAIAHYKGICPGYENCASNSQMLDYTMRINKDGNIESLSYEIVNGSTTNTITYGFSGYGSNEVVVILPAQLDSYIEK